MKEKKKPKVTRPIGRPSTFNDKIADEICLSLATSSKSIVQLCKENPHWPSQVTVAEWRIKYPNFANKYAHAKKNQIDTLVDEMLNEVNNNSNDLIENDKGNMVTNMAAIQRARLKADTIKWIACKLAPKIYGDKVQQEISVTTHEEALKKLDEIK